MSALPPPPPPPPAPPAEERCHIHPARITGRRCTRCGRSACADCLQPAAVGFICPTCVKAAAPTRAQARQLRKFNTTSPSTITSAMIAINVGIFIADRLSGGIALGGYNSFENFGLLFGPAVADGEWWRLLTGGFLHANATHLLMNMLALYQTGPILERALGPARFITLYLTALLVGSAGVMLIEADAPTVGASGAIFGLFGALFTGMRQRGIDVWKSGIGTLLVINLVITFAIPGISKGGHLGGLVGGGLIGWLMFQLEERRRPDGIGVAVGVAAAALAVALALALAASST